MSTRDEFPFRTDTPSFEGYCAMVLELIRELVPSLSRLAVLWNRLNPATKPIFEQTQAVARRLRLTLDPIREVGRLEEIDPALEAIGRQRPGALIVLPDRLLWRTENESSVS